MATIAHTVEKLETWKDKSAVISYLNMANGDIGTALEMPGWADRSIQIHGTFGTAGSTMAISPDSDITAIGHMDAEAGGATPLSPEGLAAAVLSSEIEVGYSLEQALKLILSAVAGKVSGADTTTITIKNILDNKNRIVATVDSNGNRTSLTYDVSD